MSDTCSLDPSSADPCASDRSAAAWLAAVSARPSGGERPCERGPSSRPRRQHHSADAAAGQFVDPWRGC